jgi:hypothetical protein
VVALLVGGRSWPPDTAEGPARGTVATAHTHSLADQSLRPCATSIVLRVPTNCSCRAGWGWITDRSVSPSRYGETYSISSGMTIQAILRLRKGGSSAQRSIRCPLARFPSDWLTECHSTSHSDIQRQAEASAYETARHPLWEPSAQVLSSPPNSGRMFRECALTSVQRCYIAPCSEDSLGPCRVPSGDPAWGGRRAAELRSRLAECFARWASTVDSQLSMVRSAAKPRVRELGRVGDRGA